MMLIESNFEPFGLAHLTTLLVVLVVALALPLGVRLLVPSAQRPVAHVMSAVLLIQELLRVWLHVEILGFTAELIPLHLCTLAVYLTAWMLVTQNRRLFEVVYFWGLGGTTQALLTPDLEVGFPALGYLMFFLGHGLIIVGVSYALIVFRLRPHLSSLPRVMAITAAVALVAFAVNLGLDTNFMYLMEKPLRPSLLDSFGPWPWYLLGLIFASLLSFFLLYVPFFIADLSKSTAAHGENNDLHN